MKLSYCIALIIYFLLLTIWIYLRKRKYRGYQLEALLPLEPLPLDLGLKDHVKAFISWIFLFMRVFAVKPGLYETGLNSRTGASQKRDAHLTSRTQYREKETMESLPLLVTCNNFLSVFLLVRRVRPRRVRLLVVDTDGINVWCSAGKGRFSASEIIDKAGRAGLLKDEGKMAEREKINMILPKFSLSGVNLAELKKAGIQPIIGPLYAKDVPGYLDEGEIEDRIHDCVHFGIQSSAFTALPTAVQFLLYFLGVYVVLLGFVKPLIIWMATAIAFLYPIFFPYIPGRQFAVKGIYLGIFSSLLAAMVSFANGMGEPSSPSLVSFLWFSRQSSVMSPQSLIPLVLFLVATSMFVGLSYTGNSAVSNYSNVRKEIGRFLPVIVVLYVLLVPAAILF
ncbi:MAG: hypothetical protein AB1756_01920 [Acidobacteriota bacterium]